MDKLNNILDCTFRDGGYYTNWDFDEQLVLKYLAAISSAKVDIVEIGFRFMSQSKSLGPFAYCSDDFLKSLNLPSGIDYAVMINASDLINYVDGIDKAVNILFSEKQYSPIDIVRIAAHSKDLEGCKKIANELKALGYRVFLNIMQISSIEPTSISDLARNINFWNSIEVFYFADSLGNMESDSVAIIINAIRKEWDGPIGIHTHDNKNQALSNSMKAIECGVTFVDATILGMGRGAGNARMEALLVEIISKDLGKYNPDSILPLVLNDFSELKNKYKWGPNIYYYLSAVHGIHPTYIQEMSGDKRYDTDQILSAINFLKSTGASFYNFENMIKALSASKGSEMGSWSAKNWARAKDVLIVGSGPSTKLYLDDLIKYIKKNKPVVLCLNINDVLPKELVTAYIACHQSRILIESGSYSDLKKPIILPLNNLPIELKELLKNTDVLNYGLKIQEGKFKILDKGCILEKSLALNYALSLASAGGAKSVLLTGIDGYEKSDPRQIAMVKSIEKYKNLSNSIPIYALTPTTYPIEDKSIYISSRFIEMATLLEEGKYFKLVCGAGNEDAEEVKRLTVLYTLAGAKGLDISANVEVVKACNEGVDLAFSLAEEFDINLKIRPFILVSVGMPGDHHVRKAVINLDTCIKCNLCIPVCPTDAIPDSLVVIKDKCIGCDNCSAICPRPADIIHYEHNQRSLRQLLPECLKAGAEQIELHAAVADDETIMDEWRLVSEVCPDGHISMCLDRLHLSNFAFENRIEKAKEIAKERLIIQSDGYPMSGGADDYNTTLQAIATADILNKKFNMTLRKRTNTLIYKKTNEVNQLLSGGTNSLTAKLARQVGVRFQGASIGTFARQIVKEIVDDDDFYKNNELIKKGYLIAKDLVIANVGEINE
jgi:4-hydroxy 2-oxovalerate aldolase